MNFGDFEPEDAWSPGDDPEELVANLVARLILLGIAVRVIHGGVHHKLEQVERKLRHWYKTRATEADQRALVRAADIERHIIVIRDRLANG